MSESGLFISDHEDAEIKEESSKPIEIAVMDSDEDPIIDEMPVFASKGLDLHLYQYPTKSHKNPFINANGNGIISSRIKPDSRFVEVDIPLDTRRYYDIEKANQWDHVNKQTMGGIIKVEEQMYMIGVLRDKELHMNKVNGIVQIRPEFHYFDKHVNEEREAMRSTRTDPKTSEPRAIQMSAKSSNDLGPKFSGALSSKKKFDDEHFIDMHWYDPDSDESRKMREQLYTEAKKKLVPKKHEMK